jgi:hypothetical protein
MQLTPHFVDTELGVEGAAPQIVINAIFICQTLLEPIRAQFGPVHIHDGYRPPAHNAEVGGKPTSYHLYDGTQSAADIDALPTDYQTVFNWVRLQSGLGFDKVILEFGSDGTPQCIHLQVDSAVTPRRLAYTGSTGAGTVYTPVQVD